LSLTDSCVVRNLIDRRASEIPDKTFIIFADGGEWSYRELRARVLRTARGLQDLGVRQGDYVLVWLPNGPAAVEGFFAVNYLGAVAGPGGTGRRGGVLAHIIRDSCARLMVADARLCDRLNGISLGMVETLVALGASVQVTGVRAVLDENALFAATGEPAPPERRIEAWDTQCVLYTSGTTGPSKGVLSSYLHRHAHSVAIPRSPPRTGGSSTDPCPMSAASALSMACSRWAERSSSARPSRPTGSGKRLIATARPSHL